jgi:ribosomal protein S18 acetylase RimI-like enzyme
MEAIHLIWPAEFTPQRFEAMYRIYVDSIPAAERKPDWMIRGMWEREDYRFGLAEVEKQIVGFSILFVGQQGAEDSESSRSTGFQPVPHGKARVKNQCYEISSNTTQPNGIEFYLLEYFAIDSRHRSRGIGGELFRRTIEAASVKCGAAPVLIEVESDGVGSEEQRTMCGKRIEFYRRLGCRRIVGLEYLLPLKWPVPPMELMVWMEGDSVSAATLRRWLGTIYSKVYRREANDPRIERMLGGAGDQFVLE